MFLNILHYTFLLILVIDEFNLDELMSGKGLVGRFNNAVGDAVMADENDRFQMMRERF